MHPVADPAGARSFGVRRHSFDPARGAVLLEPEVRGDMVLPDDQALLAEAGEKVEFEETRVEFVGLQIGDEIGVGVGKRELAFADSHECRQMAYRAGEKLKLGRTPARTDLHQWPAPAHARRKRLRRLCDCTAGRRCGDDPCGGTALVDFLREGGLRQLDLEA